MADPPRPWPSERHRNPIGNASGAFLIVPSHIHWANEPYYGTNHRYVWVVDELGPSREREWLQFTINAFNSIASANRPYFLYATGEQLGWSGCQQNLQQSSSCVTRGVRSDIVRFLVLRPHQGSPASIGVRIGNQARFVNDYYIEYSIAHEIGHAVGFAHDTDCASVMTYCRTVGNQYLWNGAIQAAVYVSLYDGHTN